jgi:hypothetical protein
MVIWVLPTSLKLLRGKPLPVVFDEGEEVEHASLSMLVEQLVCPQNYERKQRGIGGTKEPWRQIHLRQVIPSSIMHATINRNCIAIPMDLLTEPLPIQNKLGVELIDSHE